MQPIMIRLDDIGFHDPRDQLIISEFCRAGVQITCGVVPTWLTQRCVHFLNAMAGRFPGSLEIHQHGYSHLNNAPRVARWAYEFGPERSLDEQRNDLLRGRHILEQHFGTLFFPAFSPPFAEFDHNTLTALRQAGFVAISNSPDSAQLTPNNTLPDFFPNIDCFVWNPPRQRSWEDIALEWNNPVRTGLRGLILHPSLMSYKSTRRLPTSLLPLLANHTCMNFAQLVQGHRGLRAADHPIPNGTAPCTTTTSGDARHAS